MKTLERIPLTAIQAAQEHLAGSIVRTPLLPLNLEGTDARVHLKLECLQPTGSFELRGAANALARADEAELERGVWTVGHGDFAAALAWCARRREIGCRVLVPDTAAPAELAPLADLGASWTAVPVDAWWQALEESTHPELDGHFVHPFGHPDVVAGNGTIGLEILEDLPEAEAVVVPFSGGGLCAGVASAVRALQPDVTLLAAEVETSAPLAAAFEAERPEVITPTPSFVDGIGARSVLPAMWPELSELLDGCLVVSLDEVAGAMRTLATRNHIVAAGEGAAAVAAALSGVAGDGDVVCVVSGGNIAPAHLAAILAGSVPGP